ncbi:hypothetical protein PO909_027611 [Leuciscus waleckii]
MEVSEPTPAKSPRVSFSPSQSHSPVLFTQADLGPSLRAGLVLWAFHTGRVLIFECLDLKGIFEGCSPSRIAFRNPSSLAGHKI